MTPKDGSDYFTMDISRASDAASAHSGSSPSAMKGSRGHPNKGSVTFEDSGKEDKTKPRGRPIHPRDDRSHSNTVPHEQEARRRDRRREEAKKSIEVSVYA